MTSPPMTRAERFSALENRTFDLLVIGGGITGCGIAREAALSGLTVALVEKGDFASGTSSRSSRLIHGGVRYLEHGHLHLVFESSHERRSLLRLAPHLVRPLAFTWPVYEGARIPRWKLGAGLWLYDLLALFRNVGRHHRLSRAAVLEREPRLAPDGLRGGAAYFDAATNDARLTLANAIGAAEAGAVVLNHAAASAFVMEAGRVRGATIRDTLRSREATVHAAVVVNATGPWSDDVLRMDQSTQPAVRGSKGAHIAVPRERLGNRSAVTLLSPTDGRVFFALPAGEQAIVGTTDTYTSSTPDDVRATNEDVRYLLDAANAFFPSAKLRPDDVVSAWAGIRPLLPAPSASSSASPGAVSREHAITTSAHGLVSITGGKLTTFRVMAHDVLATVFARLGQRAPARAASWLPLPGGDVRSMPDLSSSAIDATGDTALGTHLAESYGSRWPLVWKEIQADDGRERLLNERPYTIGELRYCARHEMGETLGDLLIRRTHIAFETHDHGRDAAARAIAALGPQLGDREAAEETTCDRSSGFRPGKPAPAMSESRSTRGEDQHVLRSSGFGSVAADGGEWVSARRASRGNPARQRRQHGQYADHSGEREWVNGAHAEQQCPHEPRGEHRPDDANHAAHTREQETLADHHPRDSVARRTKRDANSQLVRALAHGVGDDAVESHGGKQQRDAGKDRDERRIKTLAADRRRHTLVHGHDREDRHAAVEIAHYGPQRRGQRRRRDRRANDDGQILIRLLRERRVDRGIGIVGQRGSAHVANDANDLPQFAAGYAAPAQIDRLANRRLVRKKARRERPIHDDHRRRAWLVGGDDAAPAEKRHAHRGEEVRRHLAALRVRLIAFSNRRTTANGE